MIVHEGFADMGGDDVRFTRFERSQVADRQRRPLVATGSRRIAGRLDGAAVDVVVTGVFAHGSNGFVPEGKSVKNWANSLRNE